MGDAQSSKSEPRPTKAPTTGPTKVDFPVFRPSRTPTKAPTKRPTKQGVHGSAHESVQSGGRGSPVLFSPVPFCPEFYSEFSPIFLRSFCASFRGDGDQKKIHQSCPPFSMPNSQVSSKKESTKVFWRAGKATKRLPSFDTQSRVHA